MLSPNVFGKFLFSFYYMYLEDILFIHCEYIFPYTAEVIRDNHLYL